MDVVKLPVIVRLSVVAVVVTVEAGLIVLRLLVQLDALELLPTLLHVRPVWTQSCALAELPGWDTLSAVTFVSILRENFKYENLKTADLKIPMKGKFCKFEVFPRSPVQCY